MGFDPFDSKENLNEDVGLFEAAVHARHVDLFVPPLDSIHLALDGSNQDSTARGLATLLAESTGAQLREQAGAVTASEILDQVRNNQAQLLVVSAPYGRDIEALRDESLGSVVDVLLLEAPCPVLCVRGKMDEAANRAALADIFVPLALADDLARRAVSWAFRVAASGGRIDLRAVADEDVIEEARHLAPITKGVPAFQPDAILRAILNEMGGIVAAAQRQGVAKGVTVHVESKVGAFVRSICAEANQRPSLIVWGAARDHTKPTFHRAVDMILAADGPVLIA